MIHIGIKYLLHIVLCKLTVGSLLGPAVDGAKDGFLVGIKVGLVVGSAHSKNSDISSGAAIVFDPFQLLAFAMKDRRSDLVPENGPS